VRRWVVDVVIVGGVIIDDGADHLTSVRDVRAPDGTNRARVAPAA
jgi:hypothetical protein